MEGTSCKGRFKRLAASMAPSAHPAPTNVWTSSIKRMICPSLFSISCKMPFRRSSNSPRYFVPAIKASHVEGEELLIFQRIGNISWNDALSQPFRNGGLAHAWIADQHGIIFVRRVRTCIVRRISSSLPMTGSSFPCFADRSGSCSTFPALADLIRL